MNQPEHEFGHYIIHYAPNPRSGICSPNPVLFWGFIIYLYFNFIFNTFQTNGHKQTPKLKLLGDFWFNYQVCKGWQENMVEGY